MRKSLSFFSYIKYFGEISKTYTLTLIVLKFSIAMLYSFETIIIAKLLDNIINLLTANQSIDYLSIILTVGLWLMKRGCDYWYDWCNVQLKVCSNTILPGILNYLYEYYNLAAAHWMEKSVNKKVGQLSGIEFENIKTLETINKAYRGNKSIRKFVDTIMLIVLDYVPELLVIIFYLFRANTFLPLILLFVVVPVLLVSKMQEKEFAKQEGLIADIQRKIDTLETFLVGVEHAIETQIYQYQEMLIRNINAHVAEKVKIEQSYLRKKCNFENFEKLILIIGHIVIFVVLTVCVSNQMIRIGVFVALITSLGELFQMMEDIIAIISGGVSEELEKIRNYFILKDQEIEPEGKEALDSFESVRFEKVSFSYPAGEDAVLKNISFEIKKGEHIAIVGANGAGKSTLIKLLYGIYSPGEGNIFFNGKAANQYVRKSIHQRFTAVFQNFGKYAMNINDNVMMGNFIRKEDLERIKHMEGLHCCAELDSDVILSREFGGTDLSGGQWQRVAIARGIYRSGDVFLLDEPTSAIDPNEESYLYRLFQKIIADKTAVIVTHRMGTVKLSEKIFIMKDGEICGIGSHSELLADCEEYPKLWYSQADLYEKVHSANMLIMVTLPLIPRSLFKHY